MVGIDAVQIDVDCSDVFGTVIETSYIPLKHNTSPSIIDRVIIDLLIFVISQSWYPVGLAMDPNQKTNF